MLSVLHQTITPSHALAVLGFPKKYAKYHLLDIITDWDLTVAETRRIVQQVKNGERHLTWKRKVPLDALFIHHSVEKRSVNETIKQQLSEYGLREPIPVTAYGLVILDHEIISAARELEWKNIDVEIYYDLAYLVGNDSPPYPVNKVILSSSQKEVSFKRMHPKATSWKKERISKFCTALEASYNDNLSN